MLDSYIEFTPVDSCAEAMVTLIQHYHKEFSVFHIYDANHLWIRDFVTYLNQNGILVKHLSASDFEALVNKLLQEDTKKDILACIVNDFGPKKELVYTSDIHIVSEFTRAILHTDGFHWPEIDATYIQKYITYLQSIHFI